MSTATTTAKTTPNATHAAGQVLSVRLGYWDGSGTFVHLQNDGLYNPAKNPSAHLVHHSIDDPTIGEKVLSLLRDYPGRSVEVWIERDHGLAQADLTKPAGRKAKPIDPAKPA